MQAHAAMGNLTELQFSGHPRLALILREHLINFSTPMSEFEAYKLKMTGEIDSLKKHMNERIDSIKRTANSAKSAANANKKKDKE